MKYEKLYKELDALSNIANRNNITASELIILMQKTITTLATYFKGETMTERIEPIYYQTENGDLISHWYDKYGANADIILIANIEKYIERYRDKNGVEDLRKAQTYLERLILEQKE